MKENYQTIDHSILESLTARPMRLIELLEITAIRDEAIRLNIRRDGMSPSVSADTTINERLQALRRDSKIKYDPATNRWNSLPTPDITRDDWNVLKPV